ncbi:FAD:protein FMN transferase [Microbacterium aureliae]
MIEPRRHVRVEHIMGTAISIQVIGDVRDGVLEAAAEACFADLRRADRVFSPFRDDSDILRLARGELADAAADPWVGQVAEACERAQAETGGLFTAWWSGVFDPTGLVKGWAVERAARAHLAPLVGERGVLAAGINAGGDMQLFTAADAEWVWRVGIADPTAGPARTFATVEVREGGVATSGSAERGAHVVDPRSGRPARGVASATVVSSSLTHADVWATAAVAAGFDDRAWIWRAGESTGILLTDDGRVCRWIDGVEVHAHAPGPAADFDTPAAPATQSPAVRPLSERASPGR